MKSGDKTEQRKLLRLIFAFICKLKSNQIYMKVKLSILAILLIFTQLSCETDIKQDRVTEYDQINYQFINKSLNGVSKDSVDIACFPIIFEIERNTDTSSPDSLLALIKYPSPLPVGNCGIEYFNLKTNNLKSLSINNIISQYSQWVVFLEYPLSLSDFKGKGEKFIGFRISSASPYPNHLDYLYGWIKIDLNLDCKNLKIIDFGINSTKNKSILTGQKR